MFIIGSNRADDMELQKMNTPQGQFCAAQSDVYHFAPFAVEVHGRLGTQATGLLRQLAMLIAERMGSGWCSHKVAAGLHTALSRCVAVGEDELIAEAASSVYGSPLPLAELQRAQADPDEIMHGLHHAPEPPPDYQAVADPSEGTFSAHEA